MKRSEVNASYYYMKFRKIPPGASVKFSNYIEQINFDNNSQLYLYFINEKK